MRPERGSSSFRRGQSPAQRAISGGRVHHGVGAPARGLRPVAQVAVAGREHGHAGGARRLHVALVVAHVEDRGGAAARASRPRAAAGRGRAWRARRCRRPRGRPCARRARGRPCTRRARCSNLLVTTPQARPPLVEQVEQLVHLRGRGACPRTGSPRRPRGTPRAWRRSPRARASRRRPRRSSRARPSRRGAGRPRAARGQGRAPARIAFTVRAMSGAVSASVPSRSKRTAWIAGPILNRGARRGSSSRRRRFPRENDLGERVVGHAR